jgi:hypothetical protein
MFLHPVRLNYMHAGKRRIARSVHSILQAVPSWAFSRAERVNANTSSAPSLAQTPKLLYFDHFELLVQLDHLEHQ